MDIEASREAWNFFAQQCESNATGILNPLSTTERSLIRTTDLLGREPKPRVGQVIIYIYSDGSIEKRIGQTN
jgi:hypothetical protein